MRLVLNNLKRLQCIATYPPVPQEELAGEDSICVIIEHDDSHCILQIEHF